MRVWSFRKSYAGVLELGNRIANLTLFDAAGRGVTVRKLAPGEFEAAAPASRFRYEVDLLPPTRSDDAAMVSWLGSGAGLLLFGDLLPAFATQPDVVVLPGGVSRISGHGSDHEAPQRARIKVELPQNWTIHSTEKEETDGEFDVPDVSRAVFITGDNLRSTRRQIGSMDFNVVTCGDWAFSDEDTLDLAEKIIKAYAGVFGIMPAARAVLILSSFPFLVVADKWSAETRGSTVSLLLGRQSSKTAALALLGASLTHELFHLWAPNDLDLAGDYSWFYEGFTNYQAVRTAVQLQLVTFQDLLNRVAGAYDAYEAVPDRDRWSLIAASQRRWTTSEAVVYQKSMLVAFLYDLTLRERSRGKHSLNDVYGDILRRHGLGARSLAASRASETGSEKDGNQATTAGLSGFAGMQDFVETFIQNPVSIDLQARLEPFGLRVERIGIHSRISVSQSIGRRQREVLRELGYNY
jgi:predicted metalloprotease with PDZ domain